MERGSLAALTGVPPSPPPSLLLSCCFCPGELVVEGGKGEVGKGDREEGWCAHHHSPQAGSREWKESSWGEGGGEGRRNGKEGKGGCVSPGLQREKERALKKKRGEDKERERPRFFFSRTFVWILVSAL